MAEDKKTKLNPDSARMENSSVGEILMAARLAKNLQIEDVSAKIHIRGTQLRAIEENNIEALPGMTYAVGFVRSYANFLGLNGIQLVQKFKAEHGHTAAQAHLSFPEPIAESRVPNPTMIGVGAFLAILVLVVWTFYSNAHNGGETLTEEIPPAPVATTTSATAMGEPQPAESTLTTTPSAAPVAEVPLAVSPAPSPAASAEIPAPPSSETLTQAPALPVPAAASEAPKAEVTAENTTATEAPVKKELPPEEKPKAEETADSPVINIKRGKTRVTLHATQSTWVQITGPNKEVVLRKVLQPGESFSVPDRPGLSLVTANAGGLAIDVDGQKVATMGKSGDIVRDVVLDPSQLKKRKPRMELNQ